MAGRSVHDETLALVRSRDLYTYGGITAASHSGPTRVKDAGSAESLRRAGARFLPHARGISPVARRFGRSHHPHPSRSPSRDSCLSQVKNKP